MTSGGRAADWKTGSFGPYGCPENLSVRFFPNSAGSPTLGLRAAAGEPKAQLAREFNISRQTLYQHFRTNE
ncbi:TPA: helix-turn-helix domain-containing protein [Pseudomonas aeruginosa]|nr:helix-turn-helix domain-containing protein [Pseudomonas aeruginosa]MBV5782266.1 helix-turn-helix domain-containing protein [Pseudomonas aeruginosa]MBV6071666.1 helix-turn-helix domain-containing protein [Pseudomonas aeruginosa]MBV6084633.1 helix-turn-helix domain-containing protein [Pseudomonas aeruginosa]RPV74566.1 hypothetical protein IPC789_29710 [Pseudomonas aeruginosa]